MTDERKDETPAGPAEDRPKRPPPTIDLEASDVSGDTRSGQGFSERFATGASDAGARLRDGLSRLAAPLGGAIAALLVLAGFWAAGLIGQPPAPPSVSPSQFNNVAANVGDLTARVTRVEASAAKAPAATPDPALAGRTEALEKALAAAREEVARLNTQLRGVSASLNELKAAPRDGAAAAAPPDLSPLNERLAQLEDVTRALATEVRKPNAATADIAVRRLIVANTLDATVRRGEPFAAALAVAKQVATDPNALDPLEAFAARGIPAEANYLREIVPVLQRIADGNVARAKPAEADNSASGATVLDRLQSGLASLVRIERDAGPAAAVTPPPTASSIRREDLATARRDIASLPQATDPQVQAWLKSVDARAAALDASQKFSAEALAAFGKSGQ